MELLSKVPLPMFTHPCRNEHITQPHCLTPREEHHKTLDISQGKCLHGEDSVELWCIGILRNLPVDDI